MEKVACGSPIKYGAGTTCSVSLHKNNLAVWTNTFGNLDKYIPDLSRLISSVGGWQYLPSLFSLPNSRIIAPDSPLTYDWWIATNQTSQKFAEILSNFFWYYTCFSLVVRFLLTLGPTTAFGRLGLGGSSGGVQFSWVHFSRLASRLRRSARRGQIVFQKTYKTFLR